MKLQKFSNCFMNCSLVSGSIFAILSSAISVKFFFRVRVKIICNWYSVVFPSF
jgi:hypothetical protein